MLSKIFLLGNLTQILHCKQQVVWRPWEWGWSTHTKNSRSKFCPLQKCYTWNKTCMLTTIWTRVAVHMCWQWTMTSSSLLPPWVAPKLILYWVVHQTSSTGNKTILCICSSFWNSYNFTQLALLQWMARTHTSTPFFQFYTINTFEAWNCKNSSYCASCLEASAQA